MTLPQFRDHLHKLCDGVKDRDSLDNPALSSREIFAELALAFNNKEIEIQLPDAAYDLEYIHLLDANDPSRISIGRDCKSPLLSISLYYITTSISHLYFSYIKQNGQNIYGRQH